MSDAIPTHVTLSLANICALLELWQCPRCGVRLWDRGRQVCGCRAFDKAREGREQAEAGHA